MPKNILLVVLLLSACTSETEFGPCIGAMEEPAPNLVYETSTKNVVLAVVFFETIFAPLLVVFSETKCPVGRK